MFNGAVDKVVVDVISDYLGIVPDIEVRVLPVSGNRICHYQICLNGKTMREVTLDYIDDPPMFKVKTKKLD